MTCPICDKQEDARYRPFCSRRCADVDLGKWLRESYILPGDTPMEEEEPQDNEAREPRLH